MIYKTLTIKSNTHISFAEILNRFNNEGINLSKPVKLHSIELKSLISILFSLLLHLPNYKFENTKQYLAILNEHNKLFKISREFGRHLLENLKDNDKNRRLELENERYLLRGILLNEKLIQFVEEVLIDSLIIKQWEYGRFFIQKFSAIIINKTIWDFNENKINRALNNTDSDLEKIVSMFKEDKLNNFETLILAYVIKENSSSSSNTMLDYMLSSIIFKDKAFYLNQNLTKLENTITKTINRKWNRNRGRRFRR